MSGYLSWERLSRLPEEVAAGIELWDRRVISNARGPLEHQRYMRRLANAMEACAGNAMRESGTGHGEPPCWQVEIETNVFFTADKSSFLTPDFLVRRCLPRGTDTTASDVVLVGEVLSGSDTPARRDWKMQRYAGAGIPWYWETDIDAGHSWDVSAIRAYELVVIPEERLAVKPLRPSVYVLAGEWAPGTTVEFPEPFGLRIAWADLAF